MTPEIAQTTFIILFVVACCVWMLSLWFSLRIGECRRSAWQDYEKFHGPSGEVVCEMRWEEFLPRIKRLMRYQSISARTVNFSATEEPDKSITFEKKGPIACNVPTGLMFSSVNLRAVDQNGNQVLYYQVDQGHIFGVFKKIALGICLFLGIPALMILSAVVWYFCVQGEHQAVRWQVLQMLQMVHVLWPPFLFVTLARHMQTGVKKFLENVIEHATDPSVTNAELKMSFVTGKPRQIK